MAHGGIGAWLLLASLTVAGCSHTLTEEDCEAVGGRLQAAWLEDANAAATAAETEQVRRFVKDEAARIEEAWMVRCRPRVGTKIAARELQCLRAVEHIDQVAGCAAP